MKIVISMQKEYYEVIKQVPDRLCDAEMLIIKNGTPLTPDILADLLMQERIGGELKQNISYSKDVIDNVRCRLTVDIIDRRPCYCGAELREVWREKEEGE